nr:glutaredoxin family protein [Lysinibacillus timonensis]
MLVKFYTRPNCSLCVDGLTTLKLVQEELPFEIEHINIDEDDSAHEKYMLMIPVVEREGKVVQYGHLDYATLFDALR